MEEISRSKDFQKCKIFFSIVMLFTFKCEIRVLISIDYRDSFFFIFNSREKCKGPPLRLLFPRVPLDQSTCDIFT